MKMFNIGGYSQILTHKGMSCTCKHGTIHCNNFNTGGTICKHMKEAIRQIKMPSLNNEGISYSLKNEDNHLNISGCIK